MMAGPKIIAFCGKGGVGKTSISALTVRLLAESHPDSRILAIDADPAIGLSTALGVDVPSTVDDIRKLFIEHVEDGEKKAAIEMLSEAKYRIFDSLVEKRNISFLAIGRPEAAGCYCKVNAYLKEVINLIASSFDYVVIDGEAGIEQVNRRVMEKVTDLILISDASKKGLQVARTVIEVAKGLTMFERSGLILNRIIDPKIIDEIDTSGMEVLSSIGVDNAMTMNDVLGESVFTIDEGTEIYVKVRKALTKLGLL